MKAAPDFTGAALFPLDKKKEDDMIHDISTRAI
jgi:hypothetical protein